MYRPSLDEFRQLGRDHNLVPVYRTILSDTLTPVSAFSKLERSDHAFLCESVIGGEKIAQYSFLGSSPFLVFEATRHQVRVTEGARQQTFTSDDPLASLEELMGRYRAAYVEGLPRFVGGAVGYAGYDAVRYVEHLPDSPPDDRHLPDLLFALYDTMVVFDHVRKVIKVVAHARADTDDLAAAYQLACRKIDYIAASLSEPSALRPVDIELAGPVPEAPESNFRREQFETAVEKCKEYIRAGDIFQVVISQRFQVQTAADPYDIYRTLRVINPSPYMFFLKCGSFHLVGASPEVMVRVEEGQVTIRPLAGTRRRGRDEHEDRALADELLADPKERAEHIMLVDLGRNDVGRVAAYNSVELSDVMTVERYSHVMHITSNVTGQLTDGKTAFDALRSCLPAGTVSGAPKVRAMQIIDELEPCRRGPYAGAMGYVDFSGNLDTCIMLRTLVLAGDVAYIQAGAGIVADSVPASEYEETVNKARGLLKAIEATEAQLTG